MGEHQCYVCKRTEDEVKELLIPNLEQVTKKYDSEITQIKSMLNKIETKIRGWMDENGCDKEYRRFYEKTFIDCLESDKYEWEDKEIKIVFKHDSSYKETVLSKYDIHKIIKTLDKLIEERTIHVASLDQQLKSIQQLRHRKIYRKIISSDGFIPKIATVVDIEPESWNDHSDHIYVETPFSLNVCAICYSLVWHETGGNLKPQNINPEKFEEALKNEGFYNIGLRDGLIVDAFKKSETEITLCQKPKESFRSSRFP